MNTILFAGNTVLIAEDKSIQQKMVDVFGVVCGRNLKMNVKKSIVMVFERNKSELIKFDCPYRVKVKCSKECPNQMNGGWRR